MLFSMLIAVTFFSAIADSTFSPLEKPFHMLFERFNQGNSEKDLFLYQRIRRIKIVKITELTLEIITFISVGMVASQICIYLDDDPEEGTQWSWMTSFYWAVQVSVVQGAEK